MCKAIVPSLGDGLPDEKFGSDPVMQQLVNRHLEQQGKIDCKMCDNGTAAYVCQDCRECYCIFCAGLHLRQGVSEDHMLQLLPQAFHNTASDGGASPRPRSHARHRLQGDGRLRGVPQGQRQWNEWMTGRHALLHQTEAQQDNAETQVEEILKKGQLLLQKIRRQKRLVKDYKEELALFDVCNQTEQQTYIIRRNREDDTMVVKTDMLDLRLRNITARPQADQLAEVESMSTMLMELFGETGSDAVISHEDLTVGWRV